LLVGLALGGCAVLEARETLFDGRAPVAPAVAGLVLGRAEGADRGVVGVAELRVVVVRGGLGEEEAEDNLRLGIVGVWVVVMLVTRT
jgi:hypothetical protein